jgi:hypothetical protein
MRYSADGHFTPWSSEHMRRRNECGFARYREGARACRFSLQCLKLNDGTRLWSLCETLQFMDA